MRFIFTFFLILIVINGFSQETTKTIDGKKYTVHTVKPSETLFAITRKYNVTINEIKLANPGLNETIDIGQEVLIPSKGPEIITTPKNLEHHVVKAGETLFAISRQYNIDVEEIKKLNDLTDNSLEIGSKLILGEKKVKQPTAEGRIHIVLAGETLYAISKNYNVSAEKIIELNNLENNELAIGQKLIIEKASVQLVKVEQKPDTTDRRNSDYTKPENNPEDTEKIEIAAEKITEKDEIKVSNEASDPEQTNLKPHKTDEFVEKEEKGVAELIPNTKDTRKYLALHRSIPVNTIIRVRNEITGKEIWARVVGKLPETGENKDILIKISQAAYDKLGALDKKFRVVITYIP